MAVSEESTPTVLDQQLAHLEEGGRLSADELAALAGSADILPLGMLADAARRRIRGTTVSYVRVALCPATPPIEAGLILPAAREVRLSGAPDSLPAALSAVEATRRTAGDRPISAYSWTDVERWAEESAHAVPDVLVSLKHAGLDALAEIPLDEVGNLAEALDRLGHAGFQKVRLTVTRPAPVRDLLPLFLRSAMLQDQFGIVEALNPLPLMLDALRPTSGYDDVRAVALARLAVPNIPVIQVDWLRYGPKLAQVALTFGADDLDMVPASDDAPEGRRRAPLEEVRRNIEAAGFRAVERDGRFGAIA